MKHKQLFIKSYDGLELFMQLWMPESKPLGVVCLVHGIGEHSSRYAPWAERFINKAIAVISFDLRGNGRSEGKRGDIPSYEAFMKDIDLLLEKAGSFFPDTPVFLYGNSMGGNLVLNYTIDRQPQIKGLIATSSWLKLKDEPPKLLLLVVRLMSKVFPHMIIKSSSNVGPDSISRDKDVVNRYLSDPMVHNKISFKMAISLHDAGEKALNNSSKPDIPLLLMHGSDDNITDPEGTREFYEANPNKYTLKIWDGLYHEIHNEPEKEEVFKFLMGWITSVLNNRNQNKQMK
jgi:alpha-beta hydrolase superfamily lysophospholipase